MRTDIIRYALQALVMLLGATGIIFFGLMTPVVHFFNPGLAVGTFILAGAIGFLTIEIVDRIDVWADRQIYMEEFSKAMYEA